MAALPPRTLDSPANANHHKLSDLSRGMAALVLSTLMMCSGCSSAPEGPPTYPVKGKVLYQGQPASGAFVVFHPKAKIDGVDGPPTAQVKADGTFELTTRGAMDGAPAGEYAVTIEWYKLVTTNGDVSRGPNVIPNQYTLPQSTPLKLAINAGENNLDPFVIK